MIVQVQWDPQAEDPAVQINEGPLTPAYDVPPSVALSIPRPLHTNYLLHISQQDDEGTAAPTGGANAMAEQSGGAGLGAIGGYADGIRPGGASRGCLDCERSSQDAFIQPFSSQDCIMLVSLVSMITFVVIFVEFCEVVRRRLAGPQPKSPAHKAEKAPSFADNKSVS